MKDALVATAYSLPGVQHSVDGLVDALANDLNVVLVLPDGAESDQIERILRRKLWDRDFGHRVVDVPQLDEHQPPELALSIHLGALESGQAKLAPRIEDLVCGKSLPRVIILQGLGKLPAHRIPAWRALLLAWASVPIVDAAWGASLLCAFGTNSLLVGVQQDPARRLSVRYMWGDLSALELRMACRLCNSQGSKAGRWREGLLPSLAGGDPYLCEHIWDHVLGDEPGLITALAGYGLNVRGWTSADLLALGADRLAHNTDGPAAEPPHEPPVRHRRLWAAGAVYHTPEFGMELHTAALAVMGHDAQVRHRLWRAQLPLLLPAIDGVRLSICRALTSAHGDTWPYRWLEPRFESDQQAVRQTPLACDLGHVRHLLEARQSQLHRERFWLPLVRMALQLRNMLAHYAPLTFSDFAALEDEMARSGIHDTTGW